MSESSTDVPANEVSTDLSILQKALINSFSVSKPAPDFEQKRPRPPDKHPLLKQLLEAEEGLKHSGYTAHVLIQRQTRDYAFAVEDVLRVLKTGTNCVNQTAAVWRGDDPNSLPLFITPASSDASNASTGESELTQIGRQIVSISEAVKCLQEEDALTFWTSQRRTEVLQALVSFSRDAVKFRRKLARIKASLEDRVRNVRRVAIKCECEITGNLVPSEIYYQWVKEDSIFYKDNVCETATASLQNLSKFKKKMSTLKNTAKNLMACVTSLDSDSQPASESETDESCAISQYTTNMSTPGRVYQIDKQIEILHKVCGSGHHEEDSVCEVSLKKAVSTTPTPQNNAQETAATALVSQLEDIWIPKPSQKCMETIASNVSPPQKFTAYEYVYDQCESRIKEVAAGQCPEYVLSDEINGGLNVVPGISICSNHVEAGSRLLCSPDICEASLHPTKRGLNIQSSVIILPSHSPTIENQTGITLGKGAMKDVSLASTSDKAPASVSPPTTSQKLLSTSMEQQISLIMNAKNSMHSVVTLTINMIREMERGWVSPETMVKSKASGKEFYQLVDFIVETAKLTEDPGFASRLYPEDKNEILSVLDPVLRELTNCFMSLHAFHNLVAVDVQYLKQLVSGFPKGNLVIRDLVSDPSIDEELAEIEQPAAATDFNVDVDELFE